MAPAILIALRHKPLTLRRRGIHKLTLHKHRLRPPRRHNPPSYTRYLPEWHRHKAEWHRAAGQNDEILLCLAHVCLPHQFVTHLTGLNSVEYSSLLFVY